MSPPGNLETATSDAIQNLFFEINQKHSTCLLGWACPALGGGGGGGPARLLRRFQGVDACSCTDISVTRRRNRAAPCSSAPGNTRPPWHPSPELLVNLSLHAPRHVPRHHTFQVGLGSGSIFLSARALDLLRRRNGTRCRSPTHRSHD